MTNEFGDDTELLIQAFKVHQLRLMLDVAQADYDRNGDMYSHVTALRHELRMAQSKLRDMKKRAQGRLL